MFCGCRVRWKLFAVSGALSPGLLFRVVEAVKAGVNKPKLLSKEFSTIINVVGSSLIDSMGFLKDPFAFICVLQTVLSTTNYIFILFTTRYEALESIVRSIASEASFEGEHVHLIPPITEKLEPV
ncbi:uncharacterized protein LOC124849113 [Vigna umbellata]|uniref:uncharacterized protein LOC124849113 n=1 Tax=Vigna umbellata TaxID=87088 RepID=UPI001F5F0926|nr:uncharacterized protein LOC124849113 [Vigna umbellata]